MVQYMLLKTNISYSIYKVNQTTVVNNYGSALVHNSLLGSKLRILKSYYDHISVAKYIMKPTLEMTFFLRRHLFQMLALSTGINVVKVV